jgi:hypothetical protein
MNYNMMKVVYSFYVDTEYFQLYGVCRLHGMVKLLQTKIFSGQQPYMLVTNYISGTTSGFDVTVDANHPIYISTYSP